MNRHSPLWLSVAAALMLALDAGSPSSALGEGEDTPTDTCASEMAPAEPFAAACDARIFRGADFSSLPGFTRSVYKRDHALVAPESRVYAPLAGVYILKK
jgi:(S)-ureidoglycine aminohydrolase